jgi:NADPH:quinone reductase
MKAIRQREFGAAQTLVLEEVPDPEPGPGQVRIDVAAAGVHLVDTFLRAGRVGGPFPRPELPMTPGREVAGTVGALGPDVDPAWLGRPVVVHLGMASGGYAERAVADVTSLHPLPDGLSPAAAVAMVGSGRTALGVLELAALEASDVLLVPAAAGGMGALFVQAGRNVGATVVGLAGGPAKVERVRELGADLAVDYLEPDWPSRIDVEPTVLLDGVGGEVGRAAFDLLGVGGRILMFGFSGGGVTAFTSADIVARSLQATWVTGPRMLRRPGGLRPLEEAALAAAATGELVPLVHPPFPLADAAAAHTALETRANLGKVILEP